MTTPRAIRLVALCGALTSLACGGDVEIPTASPDAINAVLTRGADAVPVKLNHQAIVPIWTVSKNQEASCGGQTVAGGQVGGKGNFTHLGESSVDVSVAWDVGNLLQTPPRYQAVGPAGGPVAPVLGQPSYPYSFHYDPNGGGCAQSVAATGKVVLTAANGDVLLGDVSGGEAHRLDFLVNGDGVESFIEVVVTGGTGRFADATGNFVVHTIARIQPTLRFKVTLAEVLPGGSLGY